LYLTAWNTSSVKAAESVTNESERTVTETWQVGSGRTVSQEVRDLLLKDLPDGLDVAVVAQKRKDVVGQDIGISVGPGVWVSFGCKKYSGLGTTCVFARRLMIQVLR
jgi:hypothetical protein